MYHLTTYLHAYCLKNIILLGSDIWKIWFSQPGQVIRSLQKMSQEEDRIKTYCVGERQLSPSILTVTGLNSEVE